MWPKGHIPWNVGIHPTEETRYKIGSANRGKTFSEELRKKMGEAKIGLNTWSKGRPLSEEHRRKIGKAQKGKPGHPCSEETKEKLRRALTGRILSPERRKGISDGHKGLKRPPEFCAKMSAIHKGMTYSDETKKKLSIINKKLWENPEYAKKCLCINSPNKQEMKLGEILESMYPGEWKFVGDGQVIIAGKCPDFVNVNGQKKIIEFWGDRWHQGENPQDRADIFKPYGYETLIIRQSGLKDVAMTEERIRAFCESVKEIQAA